MENWIQYCTGMIQDDTDLTKLCCVCIFRIRATVSPIFVMFTSSLACISLVSLSVLDLVHVIFPLRQVTSVILETFAYFCLKKKNHFSFFSPPRSMLASFYRSKNFSLPVLVHSNAMTSSGEGRWELCFVVCFLCPYMFARVCVFSDCAGVWICSFMNSIVLVYMPSVLFKDTHTQMSLNSGKTAHRQRGRGQVRSGSFSTFALAHWLMTVAPLLCTIQGFPTNTHNYTLPSPQWTMPMRRDENVLLLRVHSRVIHRPTMASAPESVVWHISFSALPSVLPSVITASPRIFNPFRSAIVF